MSWWNGRNTERTYYGVDNLTDWEQAFKIPVYILTYTDENGVVKYYATDENGNGMFTEAADEAAKFVPERTISVRSWTTPDLLPGVYDQTEEVEVDGTTYTCDKSI